MKKFYIVPNTETHYGRINADSKEQALEKFADSMDPDISAYFDVVRKEPVKYPQIYHQPDGKFEKAVNILVSCYMDNRDSPYYDENVRKDLVRGYMPVSMELIAELQKPYDMIAVTLQQDQPEGMLRIQKHFYRILCDVTGFILIENPQSGENYKLSDDDKEKAVALFRKQNIIFFCGTDGLIRVHKKYRKKAEKLLQKTGIGMQKAPLTFRLHQTIQFKHPVKACDTISPGSYKIEVNDPVFRGRTRTIEFDFEEFYGYIDKNDPRLVHCTQKNPDYACYKGLGVLNEYMLRNIVSIKEWQIHASPSVPVKVVEAAFEIISDTGESIWIPIKAGIKPTHLEESEG